MKHLLLLKIWHDMNLGTQLGQRLLSPVRSSIQLTTGQSTAPPSREGYGANPPGSYFHHMKEVTGNPRQGFTKVKFFLTNLIISYKMLNGFTD